MNSADIRVQLVDDDEMIRDCMTAYFEDEGFTVYATAEPEEALTVISEAYPTVCISDLRLPGMMGDEFIMKAHSISPKTAYMLHTGLRYQLSDELRGIGMKVDDVLLKPVHDLSKLVRKIRNIAEFGRKL
ncbi:MAG: response regulator [Desulfuromonadaceae bacterium]|nr:response regulator [Desulfuromonadaceae bacterium]MDD2856672.1 response regulator [Desulfuromonadaceae bacterium]